MEVQQYIREELLILVPVLYAIGIFLKKSILSDKWIPIVLGIIGIILSLLWILSTENIDTFQNFTMILFAAITQGVLVAGSSVYVNQMYIQSKKGE